MWNSHLLVHRLLTYATCYSGHFFHKPEVLHVISFIDVTCLIINNVTEMSMHTGPNRYDLSAGQLTPVHPGGKVRTEMS